MAGADDQKVVFVRELGHGPLSTGRANRRSA
jgi:hypothetical protein